jgi:NADH:ubiquinone oxidoreductase subunit E
MKITVCIGSSCHLKGARQVVERLQSLTEEKSLQDKVELSGAFCMNNCTNGVSVKIGEQMFSLKPENTDPFFENEVVKKL